MAQLFEIHPEHPQPRLVKQAAEIVRKGGLIAFPTDAGDGIESVRVNHLRLMPIDTVGERVTLECMRQATHTIWQMAQDRFGANNPFNGGWTVTQAKLTIRFQPEAGARRGKTLPLTITMPHGCDLKDRTERERMIGEKYLRRWGFVRDV